MARNRYGEPTLVTIAVLIILSPLLAIAALLYGVALGLRWLYRKATQ